MQSASSAGALTQIVREIAIVVVGILIAFGLDACWERRGESLREQAHLRALAGDFRENVERLRGHISAEERVSNSSHSLLGFARRSGQPPADSVGRLMGMVFTSSRYQPVMGAYEALVSSAGLTLLRDDSLRVALAEFAARVSGRYAERYSDELYFAFLREFAGRIRFFEMEAGAPRNAPADAALLRDPRFQDFLMLRYLAERDVAREYSGLLSHSEAVLRRLESRLD